MASDSAFDDDRFDESPWDEDQAPASSSVFRYWDWMIAGSLAWLLFEVFAQPAVSIVVASLKFGWTDFANGAWLWWRDPLHDRGRACGMFYVAAGFWRITVTTLLLLVVTGVAIAVINSGQPPQGPPAAGKDDATIAGISMMVVGFCFVLSALTSVLATLMSLRLTSQIWLDPRVRECRRFSEWPPAPRGNNQISRVVTTSLLFLAMILLSVSFAIAAQDGRRRGPPDGGFPWLMLVPIGGMVGAGVLILGGRTWVLKRVAAPLPSACWPELLEPAPSE